jgi:hypothetical protein
MAVSNSQAVDSRDFILHSDPKLWVREVLAEQLHLGNAVGVRFVGDCVVEDFAGLLVGHLLLSVGVNES